MKILFYVGTVNKDIFHLKEGFSAYFGDEIDIVTF